jgi:hypothetical protein
MIINQHIPIWSAWRSIIRISWFISSFKEITNLRSSFEDEK